MAKTSKKPAAPNAPGSELVVVVQTDAGIRSAGPSIASRSGREVSGINATLKNFEASLIPIFGPENRAPSMSPAGSRALSEAGINSDTFYLVKTSANYEEVAQALLNDGLVQAAFVKPPAEPPVIIDEQMAAPIMTEDAPPVTPNYISRQLYLNPAPGGIDAQYAWTLAGGKGDAVRIIDVEGAWRFSHEDLLQNQGGVIGGTVSADIGWRNHGTAVIGTFGGDENAIGITGISPNANTRAISIFGSTGSAGAIKLAADSLSAGDVLLIELHRPGPRFNFANRNDQLGYIAVEWWPDDLAAILYATGKGVIVVEAAGNGAENLSDALYNTRPAGFPASWNNPFNTANPTSNAVLVGAGAPPPGTHGRDHGPDRSRLSFSNYGARLDVQGWGREVTTAGYGDLQGGGNEDFWYTDTFSGTSSSSPVVVGALACIQGRLRNRSKPILNPASARNLLRTTGSPQQDAPGRPATQRIGNRPNLKQAFSTLGIGAVIKVKEVKEFKEIVKEVKEKDAKEFKEVKEKDKDFKEIKEGKEFVKDIKEKEFKETIEKQREIIIKNGGLNPTGASSASLEERILDLESTVKQLSHFISAENRPDLQTPLFNQETTDAEELQKNSNDSKYMKDNKDTETF